MKSQLALTIAVGLLFSLALSKLVPLEEIEQDPVELNKNWLSHYEKSKAALEHVEGFIPSSCQTNVSRTEMFLLFYSILLTINSDNWKKPRRLKL